MKKCVRIARCDIVFHIFLIDLSVHFYINKEENATK